MNPKKRPASAVSLVLPLLCALCLVQWVKLGGQGSSPSSDASSSGLSQGEEPAHQAPPAGAWQEFQALWQKQHGRASLAAGLAGRVPLPAGGEDAAKALLKLADHLGWPTAARMDGADGKDITVLHGALIAGQASPELLGILSRTASPQPETRKDALRDLRLLDDPRGERVMLHFLRRDADAGVRAEAAAGLDAAGSREAVETLLAALGDDEPWVREHARYALQQLGAVQAEAALRLGMKSTDARIAYESADILERAFGLPVPTAFWAEIAGRGLID